MKARSFSLRTIKLFGILYNYFGSPFKHSLFHLCYFNLDCEATVGERETEADDRTLRNGLNDDEVIQPDGDGLQPIRRHPSRGQGKRRQRLLHADAGASRKEAVGGQNSVCSLNTTSEAPNDRVSSFKQERALI